MNAELLGIAAGSVLSLMLSYIPGLNAWWDKQDGQMKRIILLGLFAIVGAGAIGLACIGRYEGVTCDNDGIWQMIEVFVLAGIANQGMYTFTGNGKAGKGAA